MRDVNSPQLAAKPNLSDLGGRLSGHFPTAACRRHLSDTPQLAAAEISFFMLRLQPVSQLPNAKLTRDADCIVTQNPVP